MAGLRSHTSPTCMSGRLPNRTPECVDVLQVTTPGSEQANR